MMFSGLLILTAFLLFRTATAAHYLKIDFQFIHRMSLETTNVLTPVEALCHGLPPGECCIPHRQELLRPSENLESIEYSAVGFTRLLENQIGFGWGASGPNFDDIKCQGEPLFRLPGPNEIPFDPWEPDGGYTITPPGGLEAKHPSPPQIIAFAASWIDLRTRFPPSNAETRWLQWQNVRGFVWGANKLDLQSGAIPFPKRDRTKRFNSWTPTGTAYLQAPARWRRPDLYRINGTNYTDSGDSVYKAVDGRFLDITNDSPR